MPGGDEVDSPSQLLEFIKFILGRVRYGLSWSKSEVNSGYRGIEILREFK